eukprot:sb/3475029/
MFASLQGLFGGSAPEQQKTPEPQPPAARRGSAAVVEHKDQVRGRPGAGSGADKKANMATVETAAGAPNIEFVKSGIIDLTIHKAENLEKCDLFGKGMLMHEINKIVGLGVHFGSLQALSFTQKKVGKIRS